MKQGHTLILKAVIILIALAVLGVCIFVLPAGISSDRTGNYRPILIGMYAPAVPFFIALYQALKLITSIEKSQVFTKDSVKALKNIKECAILIFALYTAGMPYIFYAANMDDAPGVVLIGCIFIFGSLVVATASAMFERLVQKVVEIKSENELTV